MLLSSGHYPVSATQVTSLRRTFLGLQIGHLFEIQSIALAIASKLLELLKLLEVGY